MMSYVQNTRALARTAKETGMPLVLTSSMKIEFPGLLLDNLQVSAPEAYEQRVKRSGMVDCWEYEDYKQAVEATGRKKLIMAGLTHDVCIVYPAMSAVADGYEVQVVVDAVSSPTTLADETALRSMKKHGVTLTSTNQVMAESAVSWSYVFGKTIQTILYEEILAKLINE